MGVHCGFHVLWVWQNAEDKHTISEKQPHRRGPLQCGSCTSCELGRPVSLVTGDDVYPIKAEGLGRGTEDLADFF